MLAGTRRRREAHFEQIIHSTTADDGEITFGLTEPLSERQIAAIIASLLSERRRQGRRTTVSAAMQEGPDGSLAVFALSGMDPGIARSAIRRAYVATR